MAFSDFQTHVASHSKMAVSALADRVERYLERESEQIPLWLPVALGMGIVAWFVLPGPMHWMGWICACAGVTVLSQVPRTGGRLGRMLLLAGMLGAAGCLLVWARALLVGEPPIARPAFVAMEARVVTVQPMPALSMVRLVLAPDPARTDLPSRVRVNVADADVPAGLGQGARIAVRVRLMPPAPPAVPGAYDFARQAYFTGIGATGRAVPPVRIIDPARTPGGSLRHRLSAHIRDAVPGAPGAIAATLATGDTGAISESDAQAMRRSGLAHLLSISGLHVSALIGAVILIVVRVASLSRRLALGLPLLAIGAGAGALAGIGYTLLTGAQVPTVRSCIAALLVLSGLAAGREAISLRLVATGALVVLIFWPEAVVGASFQMSFLAVTVLVALGEARWFADRVRARDEPWPKRAGRGVLALFLTGVAIELALMPVALFHFHVAGMLGALANMVAIPLTTFVIMPLEAVALFADLFGVGAPFWWMTGRAIALLLALAHVVAAQPGAVLALPVHAGWAFGVMMAGMLWLLLWRTRWRMLGLVPMAVAAVAMATARTPDLLVTGDGRHVMIRMDDGRMALLRAGAGEYVRDMMGAAAGRDVEGEEGFVDLAAMPGAHCGPDFCAVDLNRCARRWRVMLSLSRMMVPWAALVQACAGADVVIADRGLPRACTPRWLRLDRYALRASGGVAVYLSDGAVVPTRSPGDRHPWVVRPAIASHSPAP